jgi:predicted RNase H-like nuclease (RuvC/YqgF family)
MSEVNAFEESDRAARVRLEEEFARQIARGLELAGEVERLEAEVERLRELADRRGNELRAASETIAEWKAEVERLTRLTDYFRNGEVNIDEQERQFTELEAEVERLTAALEKIAATHDWHWGMDVARAALAKEKEVTAEDNSPR